MGRRWSGWRFPDKHRHRGWRSGENRGVCVTIGVRFHVREDYISTKTAGPRGVVPARRQRDAHRL